MSLKRILSTLLLVAMLAPNALAADIDDPDWRNPGLGYLGLEYLQNLEYALEGNALAMVNLAAICRIYGDMVRKQLTELPEKVTTADYWRAWAERYTSKGWRHLREGDAQMYGSGRNYAEAARAGNAEGLYKYAEGTHSRTERSRAIKESASLGYPHALFILAEANRGPYGTYGRYAAGGTPSIKKYIEFMRKAAANGSPQAFLHLAEWYREGTYGATEVDLEAAAMYAVLAHHFSQGKSESTRDYVQWGTGFFTTLAPEVQLQGKNRADAWLKEYNAPREKALEAERERRKPLTVELRKELHEVVEYIEKLVLRR